MIRRPCKICGTVDYPKFRKKDKRYLGGYAVYGHCILCQREKDRERYERDIKNHVRKSRKIICRREWGERNRDKERELSRKYYLKNKDKERERHQEYYLLNKEKILERNKLWRKNNFVRKDYDWNKNHYWRTADKQRINSIIQQKDLN